MDVILPDNQFGNVDEEIKDEALGELLVNETETKEVEDFKDAYNESDLDMAEE